MRFTGKKIIGISFMVFLVCVAVFGAGFSVAADESLKTGVAVPVAKTPAEVPATPLDMVLVLDNSGSMKKNDPLFLLSRAAVEFMHDLRPEDRLGVVIFDSRAVLTASLAKSDELEQAGVLNKIVENLDYQGQFTNIPAALERALFELKERGRPEARKSVILLTDGKIDTGSPAADIERGRWIREMLAADAVKNKIGIFGIAFTENADFILLQTLALKTGAEYYRTLKAEDLAADLDRLRKFLKEPVIAESSPAAMESPAAGMAPPVAAPEKSAVPPTVPVAESSSSFMLWLIIALGLILAIVVIAFLLFRSKKDVTLEPGLPELTLKYLGTNQEIDPEAETSEEFLKEGEVFRFRKSTILIGRKTDQKSQPNDLAIPGGVISKQHAKLVYREGEYFLLDRESTNGTFLNGVRIESGGEGQQIKHGAIISIFNLDFKVEVEGFSADDFKTLTSPEKSDGTILVEKSDDSSARNQEPEKSAAGSVRVNLDNGDSPSEPPVAAAPAESFAESPAPVLPPEPTLPTAGTIVQMEGMCSIHSSRQADHYCSRCNKLFCNECLEDCNGSYICVDCRAQGD